MANLDFIRKFAPNKNKAIKAMRYNDMDDKVVSTDVDTMDLETARQLLHQMVKDVYSQRT